MCGICGAVGRESLASVRAMVGAMHHRGPDDFGVHQDGATTIGMARLSILDLTAAGHQPMGTEDHALWIVYNGEAYNFQSERAILEKKGYSFASHTDSEVVLKMYACYGDDFLLRLRGMFALAILDRRKGQGRERLLLARDQLGVKPLLYAQARDHFVFASEMKALLASSLVPAEIDPVALRMLLTYGSVCQPRTILKDVFMLPPGHRLIFESGTKRIERYWAFGLDRRPEMRNRPYQEQVDAVAETLSESVKLQMVSDVPVGAFLSGGIDSAFLVGLMTRIAGRHVKTFSVGFEAEGAHLDETDEAGKTAAFLGADHRRVVVRGSDVRDRLEHFVRGLDQPSVDGLNSYFVSLAARRAVTVAISGTGGDEVFAGYPWFVTMKLHEESRRAASGPRAHSRFRDCAGHWLRQLSGGRIRGPAAPGPRDEEFLRVYGNTFQIFGVAGAGKLLQPEWHRAAGVGTEPLLDIAGYDELPRGEAVERVSALCLRGYTNNQLLRDIDAVSMSHSLEVRVPFLDVPLVDLALSLPSSAKLGNVSGLRQPHAATYRETGGKRILIDAGKRLQVLPEDMDCQPKRGFSLPLDAWLLNDLRDVFDDALSDRAIRNRGIFQPDEVSRVRDEFLAGSLHWTQPWLLMIVELWCQSVAELPAPAGLTA